MYKILLNKVFFRLYTLLSGVLFAALSLPVIAAEVNLSVSDSFFFENGQQIILTAQLDTAATTDVSISLLTGSVALESTDYSLEKKLLVIPQGSLSVSITITSIDDSLVEGNEEIIIQIESVTGDVIIGPSSSISTTIIDDDLSIVELAIDTVSLLENNDTAVIDITLDQVATEDILLDFVTSGSATEGADYTLSNSSLIIPAGNLSASVTLNTLDDSNSEGDENIIVNVTNISGAVLGVSSSVSATIIDDDITVNLSTSNTSITENAGEAVITATLDNVIADDVSVGISLSGSAVEGTDYTVSEKTILIPSGSTSASIILTAVNNTIIEGDKTVTVSIDTITGANTSTTTSIDIIIIEDDNATVSLSSNTTVINENAGEVIITALIDNILTQDVSVTLGTSGTAINGTDYQLTSQTVIIPAGSNSANITLTATDDIAVEGDENIIILVSNIEGASTSTTNILDITLLDDDTQITPTLTLAVNTTELTENAGEVVITATLDSSTTTDISIPLIVTGSATENSDYTINTSSIVITAGSVTGSATILSINDTLIEGNEVIELAIGDVTGVTLNGTSSFSIDVIDDDVNQVNLSLANTVLSEVNGQTILSVNLTQVATSDVVVTVTFTGAAIIDIDYKVSNIDIVIPAGSISTGVLIKALDDNDIEVDEEFIVTISEVIGAGIGSDNEVRGVIQDDDALPVVNLQLSTNNVSESNTEIKITARLDETFINPVIVTLSLGGNAKINEDYTIRGGQLIILPGTLQASSSLTIIDDDIVEDNEIIQIIMAQADGASIGDNRVVNVLIQDNDVPVATNVLVQLSQDTVAENGGQVLLRATLNQLQTEAVSITYTLSGEAQNDEDFILESDTLIIPPDTLTSTQSIILLDDNIFEGNENLAIHIIDVQGALLATQQINPITLTIIDNDDIGVISINVDQQQLVENSGVATITATLSKIRDSDVILQANIQPPGVIDHAAIPGEDYILSSQTLRIPAGSLSDSITLHVIDDTLEEELEFINITWEATNSDETIVQSKLELLLIDDEIPVTTIETETNLAFTTGEVINAIAVEPSISVNGMQVVALHTDGQQEIHIFRNGVVNGNGWRLAIVNSVFVLQTNSASLQGIIFNAGRANLAFDTLEDSAGSIGSGIGKAFTVVDSSVALQINATYSNAVSINEVLFSDLYGQLKLDFSALEESQSGGLDSNNLLEFRANVDAITLPVNVDQSIAVYLQEQNKLSIPLLRLPLSNAEDSLFTVTMKVRDKDRLLIDEVTYLGTVENQAALLSNKQFISEFNLLTDVLTIPRLHLRNDKLGGILSKWTLQLRYIVPDVTSSGAIEFKLLTLEKVEDKK